MSEERLLGKTASYCRDLLDRNQLLIEGYKGSGAKHDLEFYVAGFPSVVEGDYRMRVRGGIVEFVVDEMENYQVNHPQEVDPGVWNMLVEDKGLFSLEDLLLHTLLPRLQEIDEHYAGEFEKKAYEQLENYRKATQPDLRVVRD